MRNKKNGSSVYKMGSTVLLVLFSLGFLLSVAVFFGRWREYAQGREAYDALAQTATVPDLEPEPEALPIQVDFDALRAVNEDVIGWLYCEGTKINYPVLQGEDDNEYLRTLYDGRYNIAGSLFLDQQCSRDLRDPHPIIYGHRLENGKMFGGLHYYAQPGFYEEHPLFYYLTPEQNYKIHVFSGYTTPADGPAYQVSFSDEEDWKDYLAEIQAESQFRSEVVPEPDQQVMTFSTCNYDFEDARYVLHGVMEPLEGE